MEEVQAQTNPPEDTTGQTGLKSLFPAGTTSGTPLQSTTSISQLVWLNDALDGTSLSIPVLGSFAAAVLFILVFALVRRRKSTTKGSAILLTGSSDAGKTAIHSVLLYGRVLPSHTSLQTNISLLNLPSSEKQSQTARLIDVPGHSRIRDQFKEHLSEARAVVFVVDASTVARNGAAVAEHLHHILHALTSLPPSQLSPSLVVLAHKCDLLATSSSSAALAVSRVRTILERELEKRRASQAGGVGVGQLGEEEGADAELGGLECTGPGGTGFRFKDWEGGEIEILGSSVGVGKNGDDSEKVADGLADFKQWLYDLS
ncbi:hypothetical protein K439DRAFT_1659622 [Ramaria rubella]|nr:hypothetical protein K439DRAFT_1659622 [Ramaria rubella]